MTYQESDYDSIPPVITQARLNRILADFWATVSGFSPTGSFVDPFTYVISKIGADYYANSGSQTLFGGPDDAGGVDGASAIAVITAALNASGSIRLKANTTFPLTAKLSLTDTHNYVSIRGEGRSSVLQLACNDDLVYILGDVPPDTATHITLSDLTLDGNKAAYPAGKNALYIKHSMYDTFQNLWIKNAVEDGVHLENAQRSTLKNILIENCDENGFNGATIGGETILQNIYSYASGLNGFLFNDINYLSASHLYGVGSGTHGFNILGDALSSYNTFTNIWGLNNGVTVQGNGINVEGNTVHTTFIRPVCYDDQETPTQYNGINIETTGEYLTAVAGEFNRNTNLGAYIDTDSHHVMFIGSEFENNTVASYTDDSGQTQFLLCKMEEVSTTQGMIIGNIAFNGVLLKNTANGVLTLRNNVDTGGGILEAIGVILTPATEAPMETEGVIYYNSISHSLLYYNGTDWKTITSS